MHGLATSFIMIASYQVYEARLFRLNKSNNGEVITSVEEAVNMQKKQSALNQFYWNLSREDKTSDYQDNGKKRELMEKVTVRSCITCFVLFFSGINNMLYENKCLLKRHVNPCPIDALLCAKCLARKFL